MRSGDHNWTLDADDYDKYLTHTGHSSYTRRSYAFGVRHFTEWALQCHLLPEKLSRSGIANYITSYLHHGNGFVERKARTINHRLSVVAGFIAFCIERDQDCGRGPWRAIANPLAVDASSVSGRTEWMRPRVPFGRRVNFRRRVGRSNTPRVAAGTVAQLLARCRSLRDRALITLLSRTGQRIGDWHTRHGQHGILGMRLSDLDPVSKTITVRLKGTRRLHRVPATDDCWVVLHEYVQAERGEASPTDPLWIMRRRGQRRPLNYAAFEIAFRRLTRRCGVHLHAHVFRHEIAQVLLESTGKLQVVQAMLGHAHLSTTVNLYTQVTEAQLMEAVKAIDESRRIVRAGSLHAFAYSDSTIAELEQAIAPALALRRQ